MCVINKADIQKPRALSSKVGLGLAGKAGLNLPQQVKRALLFRSKRRTGRCILNDLVNYIPH